ncbi:MAG: DJ-1/PfpI family protein [Planctomycetota bacterium]
MARPWNIFFLLYDCVETLDFAGPYDVFSMANLAIEDPSPGSCNEPGHFFDLKTVSASGDTVTALHGLRIEPDYGFDSCPVDSIDVLIIPGSGPQTVVRFIEDPQNAAVLEWITSRCKHVPIVASVCVGALFLGKVGAFDHREATTHHQAYEQLQRYAPKAILRPGARYADSSPQADPPSSEPRILSSAGVSAGLDLAFYILRHVLGNDAIARSTATLMEYSERPNEMLAPFHPVPTSTWVGPAPN